MKKMKRLLVCILVFTMIITCIAPVTTPKVEAAKKTVVKLNKTKATMYPTDTLQLKVTGTKKKVKWSSSNKKVATVSSKGKVTAKKAGKATITAKVGSKKLKCKITVKKEKTWKFTQKYKDKRIDNKYFYRGTFDMKVGEKVRIIPPVKGKITWKLDRVGTRTDKNVISINKNGRVTAKKAGMYAVDVYVNGEKRGSVDIHVLLDDQVKVSQEKVTIYYEYFWNDELNYPVVPEGYNTSPEAAAVTVDAYYETGRKCTNEDFTWTTQWQREDHEWPYEDFETIVEVDDGKIIPTGLGTTKVYVWDRDSKTEAVIEVTVKSKVMEDTEKRAKEILAQIITPNMTTAEKVLAVYDWLALNVKYNWPDYYGIDPTLIYAAICDNQGTCEGYSAAFCYFMDLLGIPAYQLHKSGATIKDEEGTYRVPGHAYNMVQIDGNWYWLDAQTARFMKQGVPTIYYEDFLRIGNRFDVSERFSMCKGYVDETGLWFAGAVDNVFVWDFLSKDFDDGRKVSYNPHTDGILLPKR